MTPFLQMRLWWRRSSTGDKLPAVMAGALVLALAAWVLTPTTSDDDELRAVVGGPFAAEGSGAPSDFAGRTLPDGSAASPDGSGRTRVSSGATGSRSARSSAGSGTSGGTAGSGSGTARGAQQCPPTPSDPHGVSDDSMLIDFALLNLAGPIGNSAAGQAPAEDSERLARTLIDDINARGGIACRSIEPKFYQVNPISPTDAQAACIDVVEDQPAVAVDLGGFVYANSYLCVAQQEVPILSLVNTQPSDIEKFFPYVASVSSDLGTMMRTVPRGLQSRGFFDPATGFAKLGLLMDECSPATNKVLEENLAAIGISGNKVSKYTFACPEGGFASPSDMGQAVVQHRSDGVTHVIPLTGSGSFNNYTEQAERQGYRPRYGVTDYQGLPVTAQSEALAPNRANFDRALLITTNTYGIHTTPGLGLDEGTTRCQAFAEKAGLSRDMVFQGGGGVCSAVWTLEAALGNAQSLDKQARLPGLFGAGTIQMAYPTANVTYAPPAKLHGGDTWWPTEWHRECLCWRVLDPNRQPSITE